MISFAGNFSHHKRRLSKLLFGSSPIRQFHVAGRQQLNLQALQKVAYFFIAFSTDTEVACNEIFRLFIFICLCNVFGKISAVFNPLLNKFSSIGVKPKTIISGHLFELDEGSVILKTIHFFPDHGNNRLPLFSTFTIPSIVNKSNSPLRLFSL
ncbi:MAG: hypothetical protein QM764_08535 [Chitinophagaceae bacterium]